MFHFSPRHVLQSEAFMAMPWLEHGFQTRLSDYLPDGFERATLRQIHSDRVFLTQGDAGLLGEGDALVTKATGVLLTIRTADCVPLLVADPENRGVAAIHAGWRGTVAGVVPRTIETLCAEFGSRPESLLVAIGPCIRREAFEVGPEVAKEFMHLFPERFDLHEKTTVDLGEACLRQLTERGVPRANIFDCGHCSFQDTDRFHSYRRDREQSGRMVSYVGIRRSA
jgi:YfiH family protein